MLPTDVSKRTPCKHENRSCSATLLREALAHDAHIFMGRLPTTRAVLLVFHTNVGPFAVALLGAKVSETSTMPSWACFLKHARTVLPSTPGLGPFLQSSRVCSLRYAPNVLSALSKLGCLLQPSWSQPRLLTSTMLCWAWSVQHKPTLLPFMLKLGCSLQTLWVQRGRVVNVHHVVLGMLPAI